MKRQLLTSAKTDREVINLWLGRKSRTTQISYRAIIRQFLEFVDKPLVDVTLDDLELWLRRLRLTYKPATIQNKILVVKSLFSFCVEVDYLEVNVSRWTTFYSQGKIIYLDIVWREDENYRCAYN